MEVNQPVVIDNVRAPAHGPPHGAALGTDDVAATPRRAFAHAVHRARASSKRALPEMSSPSAASRPCAFAGERDAPRATPRAPRCHGLTRAHANAHAPGRNATHAASVGRVKHARVMPGGQLEEGNVVVGSKAQDYRGLLKIRYPIEHGIVQNWDDMERLWDHIYKEELKTPSEEVRHDGRIHAALAEALIASPSADPRVAVTTAPAAAHRGAAEPAAVSRTHAGT